MNPKNSMRLITVLLSVLFLSASIAVSHADDTSHGATGQTIKQFEKAKSNNTKKQKKGNKKTAKQLYQQAQKALHGQDYRKALQVYDRIQSDYPFSAYATQAQMDAIYANYRSDKPETALAAADRFLREHPRHANVDYVYYLKGLINYTRAVNQSNHYLGIEGARRDQSYVHKSFQEFSELIQRFPNSRYDADARKRMIFLKNEMAHHEWYVAHYYMRRGAWLAANRRAQDIVKKFQGTKWVPDALKIMEKSYKKLGMKTAAAHVRKIMQTNFPKQARNDSAKTEVG